MNIFCTNVDPVISAYEHCNVHCRKMIVEIAQMLSTAHRVIDGDSLADSEGMYKKTHQNHPSAVWVRDNKANYQWAYDHFVALCELYTTSSDGKVHKTEEKLLTKLSRIPHNIKDGEFFPPTPAMPDTYKKFKDVPRMYKEYLNDKFKEWASRDKPIKLEWCIEKPVWVTL